MVINPSRAFQTLLIESSTPCFQTVRQFNRSALNSFKGHWGGLVKLNSSPSHALCKDMNRFKHLVWMWYPFSEK
eukprot:6274708-Amphidinium_carterae.1